MNQEISAIALEELDNDSEPNPVSLAPVNMGLVGHLPVSVDVSIGTTDMTLEKLFSLKTGETLELNEDLNAPVTVKVDGKTIAYGHLVAVNDHFGVQIIEVAR
jgi:flagellar motor switch protein FliN/FliY